MSFPEVFPWCFCKATPPPSFGPQDWTYFKLQALLVLPLPTLETWKRTNASDGRIARQPWLHLDQTSPRAAAVLMLPKKMETTLVHWLSGLPHPQNRRTYWCMVGVPSNLCLWPWSPQDCLHNSIRLLRVEDIDQVAVISEETKFVVREREISEAICFLVTESFKASVHDC